MNEGDPKAGSGLPASVLGKSPEQIESLLRFLIFLVLHKEKMTPEEYEKSAKEDSSRTERTKKSLLELLKTDDSLRNTIFPRDTFHQDARNQSMQQVPEQDRMLLAR